MPGIDAQIFCGRIIQRAQRRNALRQMSLVVIAQVRRLNLIEHDPGTACRFHRFADIRKELGIGVSPPRNADDRLSRERKDISMSGHGDTAQQDERSKERNCFFHRSTYLLENKF